MSNIKRTCLGCGNQLPESFLNLGKMPLANAYVSPEKAGSPEPTFPLAVAYCPVCHLVQLTETVPPEEMFTQYLYFSSFSDCFLTHAREMADEFIKRFQLNAHSQVLEIGSNDGYLLKHFHRRGIRSLGIEPAKNIAAQAQRQGIPTLNRFFNAGAVEEILRIFGKADLIIGNNVLAHIPGINEFLQAVNACLRPWGVVVFEFPHLKAMLDKIEFDTIYHEHVFYLSLSALKVLVERAGLQLFDVTRHRVHGGTLRVFLQKMQKQPITSNVETIIADEVAAGLTDPERYTSFSRDVASLKQQLLSLLHDLKAAGKRIAAYGAPAKGNTLLNYCGIGSDLLEFTVDRSPHKQGLLTPGMRLPIRDLSYLVKTAPDYTLILPWNLAAEIIAQQTDYIHKGGSFIIPVPKPTII
ncbi:MAG: class I SAM-dependent methyltransferase [Ignavibacteriae bacterium]|nr:class I SAM-dependent methyltransferase [Ignavibacteriota bacterium]